MGQLCVCQSHPLPHLRHLHQQTICCGRPSCSIWHMSGLVSKLQREPIRGRCYNVSWIQSRSWRTKWRRKQRLSIQSNTTGLSGERPWSSWFCKRQSASKRIWSVFDKKRKQFRQNYRRSKPTFWPSRNRCRHREWTSKCPRRILQTF